MGTNQVVKLQREIDARRAQIHSDHYSISIGEIANMYRDGEMDIHPEFQRFYRWDDVQKSRFVESILLGIPIPSLFVAQRSDGKWDVIDGLQRLSTILQLMGLLKDNQKHQVSPLVLTKTKYLPSLEGMQWRGPNKGQSLSAAQQLYIKRAKLDFKIILRESGEAAKFELFQRLNTGGAELSDQEIRNAMLVAANREFFEWLRERARDGGFTSCVALSDRAYDEQYDLELVLRFLILRSMPLPSLVGMGDLGEFLTDQMMTRAKSFKKWERNETAAFTKTFSLISAAAAGDAFRMYDESRRRFVRGFSISSFEVIAMGIGYHVDTIDSMNIDILGRIKALWADQPFRTSSGSGIAASTRIPRTLKMGRDLFGS